jgi:hypothetical protein
MITYRITYLAGIMDTSFCPPPIIKAIFPLFNGEPVMLCSGFCEVTFAEPQIPVDLGALVKVEILSQ